MITKSVNSVSNLQLGIFLVTAIRPPKCLDLPLSLKRLVKFISKLGKKMQRSLCIP